MTTLETITTAQIRALRDEAGNAGDRAMHELAEYALDHWCGKVHPSRRAENAARACVTAIRDAEGQP